ncbi:MAG: hypothetical protein V3575_03970 [Candidatus Absconditabacteria bacterium]
MINNKLNKLINIYSKDIPEFIKPFMKAQSLKRLTDISLMCGTNYTKFYKPKFVISRLDHSYGVALIIWNFTKDPKQTLAGLFHDISHTVFSHVGDFLLGDQINQESAEKYTTKIIREDKIILSELNNLNIKIDEIDDYTKYTIADNHGPKLSADRLEYTLSTPIGMGTTSLLEIEEIYNNIVILKNEIGEDEMGFENFELGEKLGLLSIENDSVYFSSYESTISMSFASQILKYLLENNLIKSLDLYYLNEKELIDLILGSNDNYLIGMWKYYTNMNKYKIYNNKNISDYFCVSGKNKKRYIDPLIKTQDGNLRLSKISREFSHIINHHKTLSNQRLEVDFKFSD